jgi:hypothetical protein
MTVTVEPGVPCPVYEMVLPGLECMICVLCADAVPEKIVKARAITKMIKIGVKPDRTNPLFTSIPARSATDCYLSKQ